MLVLGKIYCNLFYCGNLWKWKLKEREFRVGGRGRKTALMPGDVVISNIYINHVFRILDFFLALL